MLLRERLLNEWHWRLKQLPLQNLVGREALYDEMVATFTAPYSAEEYEALLELGAECEDSYDYWKKTTQRENEIAFARPSLEQAMVLNSWAPWALDGFENIDLNRVPDMIDYHGGYRSIGNYSCNRGAGKTCAMVWDVLLWCMENDPSWKMWGWHEDIGSDGRKLSDMRYRILPRPDWEAWYRRKRVRYNGKDAPPKGACDIWMGYGRDSDWHGKLWLEFRKWMPKSAFGLREDGNLAQYKLEKRFVTKNGHNIIGKSMAAETDAWAGKAAWMVTFDEGVPRDVFREGMTRIEGGGYFHQAYTPVEAANIGEKAMVAYDIFRKKPGYELVGESIFFHRFRISDSSFLDPTQIQDNLRRWKGMGKEGATRGSGGFILSAPLVFNLFDRQKHMLPWSGTEIVAAINGSGDTNLVRIFHNSNIIRGFDEGIAHPSGCAWLALLPTGELVMYREMEESGLSITERAKIVVERSGNELQQVSRNAVMSAGVLETDWSQQDISGLVRDQRREMHTGEKLQRLRERFVREYVRRTFADSKMFKRDPAYPGDDWVENYARAGLRMERARNVGPAARCDFVNSLFVPDHSRKHLNPDQVSEPHGFKLYLASDCVMTAEKMENYLFAQYKSGDRQGEFTGKPEEGEEDILDALGYACLGQLKWIDPERMKQHAANPSTNLVAPVSGLTGY